MKLLVLAFVIVVKLLSVCGFSDLLVAQFNQWKKTHNVTLDGCSYDEERGMANWVNTIERIKKIKQEANCMLTYDMGLWEFSHMTHNEISRLLNGLVSPSNDPNQTLVEPRSPFIGGYEVGLVPPNVTYFNWLDEGAVIPRIRDQGNCACCYAIASTGALEGQIFRKTGNLTKLSDQQIIDCSQQYGNHGCGTGSPVNVYKYIKEQGITAGVNYPFRKMELGECFYNSSMELAKVLDYRRIVVRSDEFLKSLVYHVGPLAVGIYSSLFTFINYEKGIYNDPQCKGDVNHAVLLIGFGSDPIQGNYWIVKNSYGASWGEGGYIRMTRDITNFCNIWDYVVLPIFEF